MTLGSLHMALGGAGLTVITTGSHVINLHVLVYETQETLKSTLVPSSYCSSK